MTVRKQKRIKKGRVHGGEVFMCVCEGRYVVHQGHVARDERKSRIDAQDRASRQAR